MEALTLEEARHAWRRGIARFDAARTFNRKHRWGWKPTPAEERRNDCISALAEAMVAKATGRRWLSDGIMPDAPDAGDVEGGIQVRWTPHANGCLIVHPSDRDGHRFVLVRGEVPQALIIAGYQTGAFCKQARFWRTNLRHAAYFVPARELLSIADLEER